MKHMKFLFFSLSLLFTAPSAYALHWDILSRFCPEEVVIVPPLEEIPIPVGCEVIDCCPGCPGPGFIDWRINVDKTKLRGATLRFSGLDQKVLKNIKITGNAKLNEQGFFTLGTGEIKISGLPSTVNGAAPIAYVQPQLQKEIIQTQEMEKDAGSGLEVMQYRGPYVVNRFRTRYIIRPCHGGPVLRTDKIVLNNNTANDSAVVMMDHRTAACNNDSIVRVTSSRLLGNIKSKGACRSTVSVFSDNNAMSYQNNVTTWTDSLGDVHTVNLQPIITVPVSVWYTNNTFLARAQNDFANSNLLYNQNNSGIQFAPTYTNISGNAAALNIVNNNADCSAASIANLTGSAWNTANTINAYYMNSAFTGYNCTANGNLNYIGTTANLGSLPHEFGHGFSLRPSGSWGHTNGVAGFGNNNIMWGGGPGTRNSFTIGQSFRMNTNATSVLNTNGNRAGPTETCAPNVSSNICPALAIDSLPQ